jgi:uncharacterized protein (TIGR03435 family)
MNYAGQATNLMKISTTKLLIWSIVNLLAFVALPATLGQNTPASPLISPVSAFEVVSIKPSNPNGQGHLGFLSYPGGRVELSGATVKMLLRYALDIQEFQIIGEPDWAIKLRFDIAAVAPVKVDSGHEKQSLVSATPSVDQRKMILALLTDRFALKYHHSMKPGSVYFLLTTGKSTLLTESENTTRDPRGGIGITMQGIPNGDAFGLNLSMASFARAIGHELDRPVIDQTGLSGTFDFRVKAAVANEGDAMDGILIALRPLGLQLKSGKAPVDMIVIDSITLPTAN